MERYLSQQDLSPFKCNNFKIQVQKNNLVCLLVDMTNTSVPSEWKLPLPQVFFLYFRSQSCNGFLQLCFKFQLTFLFREGNADCLQRSIHQHLSSLIPDPGLRSCSDPDPGLRSCSGTLVIVNPWWYKSGSRRFQNFWSRFSNLSWSLEHSWVHPGAKIAVDKEWYLIIVSALLESNPPPPGQPRPKTSMPT